MNNAYDDHQRARPGNKYDPPTETWFSSTSILTHKRNQNLCGEAAYLVSEIRGNDRFYDVPWKVEIQRNAYDDQSWARVSRWSSSHVGGGTYGRWELVTVEDIKRLPIIDRSYVTNDGEWEVDMLKSFDPVLRAGLLTLGLI